MYEKLLKLKIWQKTLIFITLGAAVLAGLFVYNKSRLEVVSVNPISGKEQVINDFLLTQPSLSWKTVQNSKNFCVFENLDVTNTQFPVSLWVRCGEFIIKNSKVEEHSGISVAVLLDYSLEKKGYTIQMPRDGSLYGSDIQIMFSNKAQKKISTYNRTPINDRLQALAEKELLGY